jgi:hypothetical protein
MGGTFISYPAARGLRWGSMRNATPAISVTMRWARVDENPTMSESGGWQFHVWIVLVPTMQTSDRVTGLQLAPIDKTKHKVGE